MNTFTTPKGTVLPLLDLKGKPYLQVAYRLVWFCEEHPDWSLYTEIVKADDKSCTMKATVVDNDGKTRSTAHKREDVDGFFDYIEKSETGAIGRALAMVGFGTQFAADDLDEGERIVDAPVKPKTNPSGKQTPKTGIANIILQSEDPSRDVVPDPGSISPHIPMSKNDLFCPICLSELKRTKKNDAWYCPKYKDKSQGAHAYLKDNP